MPRLLSKVPVAKTNPLQDYRDFPGLSPLIDDLEKAASLLRRRLRTRRIWMLNSTATGGGVAEMMPTLISHFRDLKLPVSWLIMQPKEPAFFLLTKKLHTMLHGRSDSGDTLSPQEIELYDYDSRLIANDLVKVVHGRDLLIVHDPQPLGAGFFLAKKRSSQKLLWRCHIGTELGNECSRQGWNFLKRYLDPYRETFFTQAEYPPRFLAKKASTLSPAIDPLSDKNKWLSTEEEVEILRMASLDGQRVRGFVHPVKQLHPDGKIRRACGLNHLMTPYVLQISRWDHLKGFIPLMKGFLHMKRRAKAYHYRGLGELTRHMIKESVLILAGPEIGTVADDPEPALVLDEIHKYYKTLTRKEQSEIYIYLLPMTSSSENALIVNALQRSAEVIVQNSIREGFGLTVTEALWKEIPVLASKVGGIRLQLKEGISGTLIEDPLNASEVGEKLLYLLTHDRERKKMARHAWLQTIESFLMPVLVKNYLSIFQRHL